MTSHAAAFGGQDEVVAPDEPYDWADDPAISPEEIRARLRELPAVRVFTSREEYLLASSSPPILLDPSPDRRTAEREWF